MEDSKPIVVFSSEQELLFLNACDDWQFPIFATLLLTGLRPGELTHLLLPDDLNLEEGWLHVRNKPGLGWRVKTRNERNVPLIPALAEMLRIVTKNRRTGPVFLQRRCASGYLPPLANSSPIELEREVDRRLLSSVGDRKAAETIAKTIWRDIGAMKEDRLRKEYMRITTQIGMPEFTAPKTLRHTFATCLQDANVDPLIRNELMGHAPGHTGTGGRELGMTAVYTHTRPETKRAQLQSALAKCPAAALAVSWVGRNEPNQR